MSDNFANVPVDTTGPLPLVVDSLEFIPPAQRDKYLRTMDGKFKLDYLNEDDPLNDYIEAIGSGKVRVLSPGMNRAGEAAAQRQQDEVLAAFQAEKARLEKADEDAKLARFQAVEAKRRAQFEAEAERRRRSLGR
jgi:hypothetical protein